MRIINARLDLRPLTQPGSGVLRVIPTAQRERCAAGDHRRMVTLIAVRQLLKPDIVVSAVAVSVMLLLYFTSVGFLVIDLTTVFGFSVKNANGLGSWQWGFNVIAVIVIGVISDPVPGRRSPRSRSPRSQIGRAHV